MAVMDEVIGLFPTPLMRVPGLLPAPLLAGLLAALLPLSAATTGAPAACHRRRLQPGDSPLLVDVARLITPHLVDFGALLFGERMGWSVKEMSLQRLDHGAHQALRRQANSFVSGIVHLTAPHPSASTVFVKDLGGSDFFFRHGPQDGSAEHLAADRCSVGPLAAGDALLFPSGLLHEAAVNEGPTRYALVFDAIPQGLDSWGYRLGFGA